MCGNPGFRNRQQLRYFSLVENGIEKREDYLPCLAMFLRQRYLVIRGDRLPPEKADEIFNAFFTTKPQGSGMGLAISRSIVESHGGHIWATANAGRGATFHFTLPVVVEATQAVAAGKQAELSEPAL